MTERWQAAEPPFPVGTRVRFHGGDHRRGDESVPWITNGDEGVVVRVAEGMDGIPGAYDERLSEPLDGWSVVQFHDDPKAVDAVHADDTEPRTDEWGGTRWWFEALP